MPRAATVSFCVSFQPGTVVSLDSPAYMAPEQYAGAATSAATDQFAFCVALYGGAPSSARP